MNVRLLCLSVVFSGGRSMVSAVIPAGAKSQVVCESWFLDP
jgi:hypothetical protein